MDVVVPQPVDGTAPQSTQDTSPQPMDATIPQPTQDTTPQPMDSLASQPMDGIISQPTDDASTSNEQGDVHDPALREALAFILAEKEAQRVARLEAASVEASLSVHTDDTTPVSSCWTEYTLQERAWIFLSRRLALSPRQIQYGYFAHSETFVQQIPSLAHEILRRSLARNIIKKLKILCSESGETERFGNRIGDASPPASEAYCNSSEDLHQPDVFFSHANLPRHGLAVEIAYLHKRDRLQELAEFYIHKSNRKTRLLITIDYDPNRTSKVTLCTWRRDYTDPTGLRLGCRVQELRTENGTLVPGPPLQITMFDFARQELIPPFLHSRNIELSVEELGSILEEADSLEERIEDSDAESSSTDDADEARSDTQDEDWPFETPGLVPFPG